MSFINALHLLANAGMVAVIWLVQLVKYPGFKNISAESFSMAMRNHQHNITYVVAPLMLIELTASIGEFLLSPNLVNSSALLIVLVLWLVTYYVQVPIHDKLLRGGFDTDTIRRLVSTNWVRTGLWSLKLFVVFSATVKAL